jgi:hypothetical protein
VRRAAEAAGDQRGLVVRLRGAAHVSAAGRQPRSLLPAGPQRTGKSCSFVLTTCCFLQTFFQELKPLLMCSGCSFLVVYVVSKVSSFQELKPLGNSTWVEKRGNLGDRIVGFNVAFLFHETLSSKPSGF